MSFWAFQIPGLVKGADPRSYIKPVQEVCEKHNLPELKELAPDALDWRYTITGVHLASIKDEVMCECYCKAFKYYLCGVLIVSLGLWLALYRYFRSQVPDNCPKDIPQIDFVVSFIFTALPCILVHTGFCQLTPKFDKEYEAFVIESFKKSAKHSTPGTIRIARKSYHVYYYNPKQENGIVGV